MSDELPPRFEPGPIEARWQAYWAEREYFRAPVSPKGSPFVIPHPPPNVTGVLTMGHMLGDTTRDFVYLKRQVPPETATRVAALRIAGIHQSNEYRRYYPAGETMAHVLGFTDVDGAGQEGIELAFEAELAGLATGAERAERALHRTLDPEHEEAPALWNEVWSSARDDAELRPLVQARYRAWAERIVRLLQDGREDGSVASSVDPEAAGWRLAALADGLDSIQ